MNLGIRYKLEIKFRPRRLFFLPTVARRKKYLLMPRIEPKLCSLSKFYYKLMHKIIALKEY